MANSGVKFDHWAVTEAFPKTSETGYITKSVKIHDLLFFVVSISSLHATVTYIIILQLSADIISLVYRT